MCNILVYTLLVLDKIWYSYKVRSTLKKDRNVSVANKICKLLS